MSNSKLLGLEVDWKLGGRSAYGATTGWCGYRFNAGPNICTVRFRHYDPTSGIARWMERDPAGYMDGASLYMYGSGSPTLGLDAAGLYSFGQWWYETKVGYSYARDHWTGQGPAGAFVWGVGEGAVVGLGAVAALALAPELAPLALLYGASQAAQIIANWGSMTAEERAEVIGNLVGGGLAAGASGSGIRGFGRSREAVGLGAPSTWFSFSSGSAGGISPRMGGAAVGSMRRAAGGAMLIRPEDVYKPSRAGFGDLYGGVISNAHAMDAALQWLGQGYYEFKPDIFRSRDGLRQFRMTPRDLSPRRGGSHVHFESVDPATGAVIENAHVYFCD